MTALPPVAATAPWITQQMRALLTQRGHALLLAGPSGLGQLDLALALAQAWLCEHPTPDGACGRCSSCHAIAVRTHPELMVLLPDVQALASGWPIDPALAQKIENKEVKPSKWIRVESARRVVEFAQTTRSRGTCKVVLVHPADRLNVESANTLLKTLEEPAGDLRFVLATESAHALPATIRSRCQTHTLTWPDEAQALAWLHTHHPQADAAQVRVWLQAAGGRPTDALIWAQRCPEPQSWLRLPKAVAQAQADGLLSAWPAAEQLALLQKICHDVMAVAVGAAPRFFPTDALPPAPPWPMLQSWAKALSDTARVVEHPFHGPLALDAWLAHAHAVLSARAPLSFEATHKLRA